MPGYGAVVTEKTGELVNSYNVDWALLGFGDTYQTVEQMYGMIHYLAARLERVSPEGITKSHADIIEEARLNFRRGIQMSPGIQPKKFLNG
jgi:hypothetical protein